MQIWHLIKKDLSLEWRSPFLVYGALLFVLSSSYTSYLAFEGQISEKSWLSILWILMTFSSLYAASQAFIRESNQEYLLFYSLVSPQQLMLGKLFYQVIFQSLICLFTFLSLLVLFQINPLNTLGFLAILIASSWAISALLTVMGGIAARAGKSSTLLSILCLPLLYPILMLGLQAAKIAMEAAELSMQFYKLLGLIGLIFGLIIALALVLFPYLWRD